MLSNQDAAEGLAKAIKQQAPMFKDKHYMGQEGRWDGGAIGSFVKSFARGSGIKHKDKLVQMVIEQLGPYPNE